ncbi:MAG: DUF2207 domain-containing protein [Candidatus Saccharimonadales bacterium]
MKKLLFVVLGLITFLGLGGIAHAGVNDFTISDYQIDMHLGRDSDGRSTLKTVEKITAVFPKIDQNHGIERAVPKSYDNHPTSLSIESVTDESGKKIDYSTYDSNENEVVRIGDADTYVHGNKTYILTYTQRDVTRYFADTTRDEFYWDTNGVDWRVPIEALIVRLQVDQAIAQKLVVGDEPRCYMGASGSADTCTIDRDSNNFIVRTENLEAGQNVTVALGFTKATFAAYQPSFIDRVLGVWAGIAIVTSGIAIGVTGWLWGRWARLKNRSKELGTIIPEYIPPKDTSVTVAAEVIDTPRSVMTAQLLDLAVRHYIKIIQTKEKSTFKKAEYDLEIIRSISDLKWEEQELLRDLFTNKTDVGSKMSMKTLQSDTAFYTRIQNNSKELTKRVRNDYALRAKNSGASKWFTRAGFVMLGLGVVLLAPFLIIAAIGSFIFGATLWPLTDKGLDLQRYLYGLKMYIGVAEAERIKMLQGPDTAVKVGESIDPKNQPQMIKLYERVLPYAVLFGQEKQWNEQLGKFYQASGAQPDWYAGTTAFNAASFSTGMNSFAASASYASPSSSSSGGSGGGGSSGGGGGGGGGGGW